MIRDFNRCNNPKWNRFNSSVVRWNIGQHPQIYRDFIQNPAAPVRRFHGDQDWLYAQVKNDFNFSISEGFKLSFPSFTELIILTPSNKCAMTIGVLKSSFIDS